LQSKKLAVEKKGMQKARLFKNNTTAMNSTFHERYSPHRTTVHPMLNRIRAPACNDLPAKHERLHSGRGCDEKVVDLAVLNISFT
jgi:hypothetical protein